MYFLRKYEKQDTKIRRHVITVESKHIILLSVQESKIIYLRHENGQFLSNSTISSDDEYFDITLITGSKK